MKVAYKGRDDFRVLGAADLKKVNVEGFKQTTFPRNTPVEVADPVGEALTNPEYKLFGKFERVEDEVPTGVTQNSTEETPSQAPLAEGQDPANSNAPEADQTTSKAKSR